MPISDLNQTRSFVNYLRKKAIEADRHGQPDEAEALQQHAKTIENTRKEDLGDVVRSLKTEDGREQSRRRIIDKVDPLMKQTSDLACVLLGAAAACHYPVYPIFSLAGPLAAVGAVALGAPILSRFKQEGYDTEYFMKTPPRIVPRPSPRRHRNPLERLRERFRGRPRVLEVDSWRDSLNDSQ